MSDATAELRGNRSLLQETLDALRPPTGFGYALQVALTSLLALYVAMWLELDRPQWAAWTVFVVSLPGRGDNLRKTVARSIGTPVGCVAGLALAALFPQQRFLFVMGLGLWVGACGYAATFQRGFVAYAAVLAAFTAVIVAAGAFNQPTTVFNLAIGRGSATLLGALLAGTTAALAAGETVDVPRELADRMTDAVRRVWAFGTVTLLKLLQDPPIAPKPVSELPPRYLRAPTLR